MLVIDRSAIEGRALAVRFAALTHDLGKGTTPREEWPHHGGHEERSVELVLAVARRIKVPNDCRELAVLVARWHGEVHDAAEADADALVTLLSNVDAFRQPARFELFLQACEADYRGRPGYEDKAMAAAERLRAAHAAAAGVDAGAIAARHRGGEAIKQAVFAARVAAVGGALE
jgi:tRNA nucleotidyltransferase (CCA-adding enzyme)